MKKIYYIHSSKLHFYPPCVSQIRMLKELKIDIEVLYGTCNESALKIFSKENIKHRKISNLTEKKKNIFTRLIAIIDFRIAMKKELKKIDKDDILWFGNVESIIPLKGLLAKRKYLLNMLELYDEKRLGYIRLLIKGLINNAKAVIVCEETRRYITQYFFSLEKLPYLMPNKPYSLINFDKNEVPDEFLSIINELKNKKYIIYQGILQNTEELIEIAKSLNSTNHKYYLVLMGIDEYNSVEKIRKYYDNIVYIRYIPAPYHLIITQMAKYGIAFYRPFSLNNAFCAPNKIYEYTGFGIPVICNKIPGLENTIGMNKAGKCIDLSKSELITQTINEMDNDYELYKKNALDFYNSCDNLSTMKEILSNLELYSKK